MLLGGKRIYICVIVYLVYVTAKLPQKDKLEWFYIGIRSRRGRRVSSPTLLWWFSYGRSCMPPSVSVVA